MHNMRYRICELFGIPVYVELSFLVLLFIFISNFGSFSFGVAAALALAVSITLHELGHALTARAFGCETRDISLSFVGGCASLAVMPRKAWQEFLTAAAGPLVSFVLFAVFGAVLLFVPIETHWTNALIWYVCVMNLVLGLFNLLPGFPMDGGRIFRSLMRLFMSRAKATFVAMLVGRVVAIFVGLRGLYLLVTGGNWGFISIMIAWMIWREGMREYLQALAEDDFGRWTQDDFNARVSPPPYDR